LLANNHQTRMLSNLTGYFRPKSTAETLALLQKNSGTILMIAGGTKLVSSQNDTVRELVDITGLNLDYIKEDMGVIRVGATTPLQKLVEAPIIKKMYNGIVSQAALLTQRSRMIRNMSTIGGELITTKSLSILYCVMLVLQAQVRIAGGEEFALAMNIFLNKKGVAGGLLMEVLIPYIRNYTYTGMSGIFPTQQSAPIILAGARLSLNKGLCENVKIAITGTEKVPQRIPAAETLIEGRRLSSETIAMAAERVYEAYKPMPDALASEEFRKEVSRLVVKKALHQCLERAEAEL